VPQRFLDCSAEHPEKQHIAQQVHPSPVQEHACEHREDGLREGDAVSCKEQLLVRGNKPECVNKRMTQFGRQGQLMKERENIHRNQQGIENRETRAENVHPKRYHRAFLKASSNSGVNAAGRRRPFRIRSSIFSRLAIPPLAPIPMQERPAAAQLNSSERGSSSPRKSA
jgi:hypothetical protein